MTRSGGFTLLEMLVALVVLGVLVAGLVQGVQYGVQAWRSQVRVETGQQDLDAVDRTLRHLIGAMDPGNGFDPAPLAASRDRLAFISSLPDGGGAWHGQPVSATLLVDAAHHLVLRWRPFVQARPMGPQPTPVDTVLLTGVTRLDLSFWRPTGGWITSWPYQDLPPLVRLHLVFAGGDPRHWPDLVVAPRLNHP